MTSMSQLSLSPRPHSDSYASALRFAALFAVISYLAVSARAILNPYEMHAFFDAKRLLSVAAGALVLWLAIRDGERRWEQGFRPQILKALNVAIPGAIALLVAREAWDLAASGEIAQRLAHNTRWMLTWTGYFAAAVAGFLAFGYHRQLQAVREGAALANLRESAAPTSTVAPARYEYEVADSDYDPRNFNDR